MPQGVNIDFNANIAKFERQLERSTRDMDKWADGVKKSTRDAGNAFKKFKRIAKAGLAGLSGGLAIRGLDRIADSVAAANKELDVLGKASRRVGLTAEELQRIRIEAEASGVEVRSLDLAFQRFARRVGSGQLDDVFKELNIQLRDSEGRVKTNNQLWQEFGKGIRSLGKDNRALALTFKAVDAEGVKVIELFRRSDEEIASVAANIEKYGLLFDQNLIEKAETYTTELGYIRKAIDVVDKNTAAGLSRWALEWEKLTLKIRESTFELLEFAGAFGVTGRPATDEGRIAELLAEKEELEIQRLRIAKQYINEESKARRDALEKTAETNRKFIERNAKLLAAARKRVKEGPKADPAVGGLPDDPDDDKGRAPKVDRFLKSFQRLEDTLDPINKKTREFEENIKLLDRAFFEKGIISAERYDQLLKELTTDTTALDKASQSLAGDRSKALSIISDLDPVSDIRDQIIEVQRLQEVFKDIAPAIYEGLVDAEFAFNESMDGIVNGVEEKTKDLNETWQELGGTFASAFEDAIVAGAGLQDILKGLEQDIIRILTRKLVTEPLTTAFSDFAKGAFSGGGGGFNPFAFLTGKAAGGPVMANQPYIVGEKGAELFVPKQSGNIIPNGAAAGGVVNVYQTVQPGVNPDAYRRSARQGALEGSRILQTANGIA